LWVVPLITKNLLPEFFGIVKLARKRPENSNFGLKWEFCTKRVDLIQVSRFNLYSCLKSSLNPLHALNINFQQKKIIYKHLRTGLSHTKVGKTRYFFFWIPLSLVR